MRVAIIGNGVAGITAARTLREADSSLDIVILAQELHHYYPRPWLIEFLAGASDQASGYFYKPQWYTDNHLDVRLGMKVTLLDPAAKSLVLANGETVIYDRLLLAAGGQPNVPPIEGTSLTGVFTLRTIDDALRIKNYAKAGMQAVVVGGGLLGLESARALKGLGLRTSVLQNGDRLLPAQLDSQGAALLKRQIEAQGISIELNASSKAFQGNGAARTVALEDGRTLPADMVLISAGVRSNVELARAAGLTVNRGVVVDGSLRASAPGVYAAGDVAEFNGRVYGIVPAAMEQGKAAAQHMLGLDSPLYQGTVPSNTLQVVGVDLTSVGVVNPEGDNYEEIRWSDDAAGIYKKLVLQQGRTVGSILLGDRKSVGSVSRLVREKVDLTAVRSQVLEPGFDFKSIPR